MITRSGWTAAFGAAPFPSRETWIRRRQQVGLLGIRSATVAGQSTWITHGSGGVDTWTDFGAGVGFAAGDKAVTADYDGDGKTDVAVWRPSEGNWYILHSNGGTVRAESFGLPGDDPAVVGDYNGDGKDDMAVYRPGAGNTQSNFYYRLTAGGGIFTVPFGLGNDIAVRGDFAATHG